MLVDGLEVKQTNRFFHVTLPIGGRTPQGSPCQAARQLPSIDPDLHVKGRQEPSNYKDHRL